jgi:hypothetical protein
VRKIAHNPIFLIAKDRLHEANVQRDAKIENAEAVRRNPSSWIAKPGARFAISEGIRITLVANPPVSRACSYPCKIKPCAVKVRGWQPTHYTLAGLAGGPEGALGCIDDFCHSPAPQCLHTSQATELWMMLH